MTNGNLSRASRGEVRIVTAQDARGSVAKVVRSMLDSRIEHKRTTAVGAYANLASAGVVNTISLAITQGDGIGNRAGDIIRPTALKIRVNFRGSTTNFGFYTGRFVIFQDTMCNGATPAVLDLLATADPLSGYNTATRQARRFKILHDRILTSVGQTKDNNRYLSVDLAMKGNVHYLASTGGASDQGKNSLFALFIADLPVAGVNQYAWSYDLEFTDA